MPFQHQQQLGPVSRLFRLLPLLLSDLSSELSKTTHSNHTHLTYKITQVRSKESQISVGVLHDTLPVLFQEIIQAFGAYNLIPYIDLF